MRIHYATLFLKISIKTLLILGFTLSMPSLGDLEHVAKPLYVSVFLLSLSSSISNSL